MADDRDPPIEEPGYIAGVSVVDIGDVRVARGLTRRHHSSCRHLSLVFDNAERRVWCKDCERDVEPFDAFTILVANYSNALDAIKRREAIVSEAEKFQIRSIAAKNIDQAWRHRTMVPACPHCHHGLFPENFKHGPDMLGIEYAKAMAERTKRK
jgi:hypothetical protein